MAQRFGRFLMSTAVIGVLLLVFLPVGGVIIAGLLFPILLIIGLPIYVLLALGATVGGKRRR